MVNASFESVIDQPNMQRFISLAAELAEHPLLTPFQAKIDLDFIMSRSVLLMESGMKPTYENMRVIHDLHARGWSLPPDLSDRARSLAYMEEAATRAVTSQLNMSTNIPRSSLLSYDDLFHGGRKVKSSNLAIRLYLKDGWSVDVTDRLFGKGSFVVAHPLDVYSSYLVRERWSSSALDPALLLAAASSVERAFPEDSSDDDLSFLTRML